MTNNEKYFFSINDEFCWLVRPSQVDLNKFYDANNGFGFPEREIIKRLVLAGKVTNDDVWRGIKYQVLMDSLQEDFKRRKLEHITNLHFDEPFVFGTALSELYLTEQITFTPDLIIFPQFPLIERLKKFKK